jgi:hypothetical protein
MILFKELSLKMKNIYSLLILFLSPIGKTELEKTFLQYPKLQNYFDYILDRELIVTNKYRSKIFFKASNKGKDFINGYENDKYGDKKNNKLLTLQDLEIAVSYYCTLGSFNRRRGKVVKVDILERKFEKKKRKKLDNFNGSKIYYSEQNILNNFFIE